MKAFSFPSYAKLNLHLRIVGREENHYHTLQMLSIKISLHDQIHLSTGEKSGVISIRMNSANQIPAEKNLVYQAIKAFWKDAIPETEVSITKNIPMQAGLGGGSSNAASTLLALNQHFAEYNFQELAEIGFRLGCDVPFFLGQEESIISGRGEKVLSSHFLNQLYYFVVVKPSFSLSTKKVYQTWDQLSLPYSLPIEMNSENALVFYNDLLLPARQLEPELDDVLEDIHSTSPLSFSMTGSGSACFGCYRSLDKANQAKDLLSAKYPFVFVATNLPHG